MTKRSVIIMSMPLVLYLVSLFLPGIILKDGRFNIIAARSYDEAVQVIQSSSHCVTRQGDITLNDQGIPVIGSKPLTQATDRNSPDWHSWACRESREANSPYTGFEILLIGILGDVAWFANPVGWAALVLGYSSLAFYDEPVMRQVMALASGLSALAAFLIAQHSYSLFIIHRYEFARSYNNIVDRLGSGFYLWESSFALLATIQIVAFVLNLATRRRPPAQL